MPDLPREPTRVEIVIDTDDPNPDLLFIWAAARAVNMVEQLRKDGVPAELVKVAVDGRRQYVW